MTVRRTIPVALVVLALVAGATAVTWAEPELTAGAAIVEIPVPSTTPLAGYGGFARRRLLPDVLDWWPHAFWFKSHEGSEDPIVARALVLEQEGRRLVWISADLIAVDRTLTADVTAAVERAIGPATVILSATHTHSGPGAFVESGAMGFAAMDRLARPVRAGIVAALVESARRADGTRVSARIGAASAEVPDVTRPRLAAAIDRELVVLKLATPGGRPIALLWNFAIHPTTLGARNLKLSGDVTGVASRALEASLGVPALFVNGSVGDVSPRRHGKDAMQEIGAALARAVDGLARGIEPRRPPPLATRTIRVRLGSAALSLRHCLWTWIPGAVTLPLRSTFPPDASLTAVALGDIAWVTVPGELQSALGGRIKRAAAGRWRHRFVAGVSNDYLGYFVERAEYARAAYVTCATLYGPEGGERLAEAAVAVLRDLGAESLRDLGAESLRAIGGAGQR